MKYIHDIGLIKKYTTFHQDVLERKKYKIHDFRFLKNPLLSVIKKSTTFDQDIRERKFTTFGQKDLEKIV